MRTARVLGYILAMTIMGAPEIFAQDRSQGRSMVISRGGIVAAESPLAAQAGVRVLESGGGPGGAARFTNARVGGGGPLMRGIGGGVFLGGCAAPGRQSFLFEGPRGGPE